MAKKKAVVNKHLEESFHLVVMSIPLQMRRLLVPQLKEISSALGVEEIPFDESMRGRHKRTMEKLYVTHDGGTFESTVREVAEKCGIKESSLSIYLWRGRGTAKVRLKSKTDEEGNPVYVTVSRSSPSSG